MSHTHNDSFFLWSDLVLLVILSVAASWGELTYLIERYGMVGKDKSLGIWDLCVDNPTNTSDGVPYPFPTQYCLMDVVSKFHYYSSEYPT